LSRSCSISNEGLKTKPSTPSESAAAALLHVVRSTAVCNLIAARAVVKIKQDMVLAIDTRAFVAFDLEKVEFFAIQMKATVANVFENSFVLGHSEPFG
jgi:hypothetical protein